MNGTGKTLRRRRLGASSNPWKRTELFATDGLLEIDQREFGSVEKRSIPWHRVRLITLHKVPAIWQAVLAVIFALGFGFLSLVSSEAADLARAFGLLAFGSLIAALVLALTKLHTVTVWSDQYRASAHFYREATAREMIAELGKGLRPARRAKEREIEAEKARRAAASTGPGPDDEAPHLEDLPDLDDLADLPELDRLDGLDGDG